MKRNKKLSMLLAMGMTVLTTAVAGAATNPAGSGKGIAIGTGSNAPLEDNVAIGDNATILYSNGNPAKGGDIAIGADTNINNYMSQVGSIAIGNNAKVENMTGEQEKVVGMGQTRYNKLGFGNLPLSPEKVVTGIAIGENAFSRSGSVMLGNHKYDGKIGDTEVASNNTKASSGLNVLQTIIGTNSYSKGSFATVTGAYSAITGGYNGESDTESKVGQNFGANIVGSLNTIESKTSGSDESGMASSIMGVANRTANSNGSLIFGAGNTVTNSLDPNFSISTPFITRSAKDFQDKLMKAIKNSKSGGAVLALGGGNTVDYAIKSQVMGVNNTLKGANGTLSTFNLLNGYNNEGTTVNHISVIGSNNSVKNTDNAVVIGDNRNLASANNAIVLGSADKKTDLQVADAVAIGHNADVKVAGGVALGANSVASVDAGAVGYDPNTDALSTETSSTWKATDAAVSVGNGTDITRQITGVAAGTNDTDAVNVAQLKQATGSSVHYYSVNSTNKDDDSNYNNDGAKGTDSMVIGINSSSEGINSTVIGKNNHVTGNTNDDNSSAVVGTNLTVEGIHNAVFGTDYNNDDTRKTMVAGAQNTVLGVGNLVGYKEGENGAEPTKIGSDQNVAVGMKNTVNGGSVAVGEDNNVEDLGEAFGHGNTIIGSNDGHGGGQYGLAVGSDNTSKGEYAITVGGKNSVEGNYSIGIGKSNTVTDGWAIAIGTRNTVEGQVSIAIGEGNTAKGTSSVAIGSEAESTGDYSIAMGDGSKADGKLSVAIGSDAKANVAGGVALGANSVASVDAGAVGYDPNTAALSTETSSIWKATDAAVSVGDGTDVTRQITGVAAGTNDTDAVNVAQLKKVAETVKANADTDIHVKAGNYAVGTVKESSGKDAQGVILDLVDKNGNDAGKAVITDVAKASDVGNLNYVAGDKGTKGNVVTNGDTVTEAIGKLDAAIDKAAAEVGKHTEVTQGNNVTVKNTAKDGEAANYEVSLNKDIKVDTVTANTVTADNAAIGGVEINKDNKGTVNGLTNTTWNPDDIVSGQAATEDQLKEVATEAGKHTVVTRGDNVTVKNIAKDGEAANYEVSLNKDIKVDTVTANTITSDNANIGGVEINKDNSGKIENVNDGIVAEGSKDVINGGQLYATNQLIKQQGDAIYNINNRVSDLDNRMNKVGAGAAALAALHPLDFEPDDKFNVAVGYGNYKDADAMAIGAFYRPDEKTMFSVGGSMGNGENMINVGVSLKFGKHSEYSGYSRTQLVEVITGQNKTIAEQGQTIDDLKVQIDIIMKELAELKK